MIKAVYRWAAVALAALAAGQAFAEDQEAESVATAPVSGESREIVIGAGEVSGVYFPAAGAICRVVAEKMPGARCLVESNGNSSANIERLTSGLLDLAIVQSDWLMHAARGTNLFHGKGPDESLRAVMSLHAEPLTLLARADSGISGPADLEGKRIGIGPAFTYQRVLIEAMLRAWDIDEDDLALVMELGAAEQFSALCAGEIDAGGIVTPHPSPELAEAMLRCDLKIVPVEGDEVKLLLSERPDLAAAEIGGGLYVGITDPIPTFGLRAILASTAEVGSDLVRRVTEAVISSLDELRRQHPALAGIDAAEMPVAGIALPLHTGAETAYRERRLLPAE